MRKSSGSLCAIVGAVLALAVGSIAPVFAEEGATGAARQLLFKKAIPAPAANVETRVIRVKFPSGFKTPLHTHDGPGPRYVLKGRLRVEDSGETHVYGSGDVFWETGGAMTVENIGGGDAEIVIFELAPGQ